MMTNDHTTDNDHISREVRNLLVLTNILIRYTLQVTFLCMSYSAMVINTKRLCAQISYNMCLL